MRPVRRLADNPRPVNPPPRALPEKSAVDPVAAAAGRLPAIEFPEALPVSARRAEIAEAMSRHQVIVVCGETGSGKTTQLPKIALALGRGRMNAPPGQRGRLIGHTQPRRIAAASVAKRIAEELKTPLGEVVGYKVRFQDRLSPGASVKLMTDGILLAETQGDRLLDAYDTLIIDEAHERSLNIDFLLGYLREVLPRRPDLKVVVTSATIDADRFARHFAGPDGPAPVIQVSGRLYPVELRWRPFEEGRDYGPEQAIADAVDELWRGGAGGDILVFLPGEREIRDTAEHLRRHLASTQARLGPVDVLPLFARLSQAEQDRVFQSSGGRRVVLATNVAETSLTVPGIRYVVDGGEARVKRYSFRNKVEQLQVEPVSQAAANQRAGRCGRVADGICIRLYDEADFAKRPLYTDPEILRSSLAGVILRMKSLGLGDVEAFPFLEPPPRRAIADGYALLGELNAVDDGNELTAIGRELARLPLDPRVGRMILEARSRESLAEVLVIAAALTGQDVRDRPLEAQQAADERHRKFDDERSEFSGFLKLWRWIEEGRGHASPAALPAAGAASAAPEAARHGTTPAADRPQPQPQPQQRPRRPAPPRAAAASAAAAGAAPAAHKLSHRQQEQRLRDSFVNPRRVREWRDIHAQLHTVVAEHGWRLNTTPASYEQIHLALLAGLLGNIGCKSDEDDWYLGARGIKFWRHPGVHLSKKPGRWVVAGELVETTRLYGRAMAGIEPQWIPQVAGHLLKTQLLEPHWEKKAAEVIALERATLYGLVVYSNRRVAYARVDAAAAREIFIREALVAGEWDTALPFLAANRRTIEEVRQLEHKSRRQDVLVDDEAIFAFYDRLLPADVHSGATFERWWRGVSREQPKLLHLTRDELMRHEAAGITGAAYPKLLRLGGIDCAASYLHAPGDAKDGVTVGVPLYALNQASEERAEWLVPGLLKEKLLALLKSLPQKPRSRLVPLAEFADAFVAEVAFADGGLLDALLERVRERTQLDVRRADFRLEQVPPHLFMNFRVEGEHGRQLAMGRNLAALKAEFGGQARSAFQALAGLRRGGDAGAAAPAPASPSPSSATASTAASRQAAALPAKAAPGAAEPPPASARYTDWTFGELPELMEVRRGGQTLIGFPALIDRTTHVEIEVFDEPEAAAARHRAGLRRLIALQVRDALKALEKNIPELQKLSVLYMPLGTADELRAQIVEVALDRAFLAEPLPTDAAAFRRRLDEGRGRLALIAHEVARIALQVLVEHAAALRKLKDARPPKDAAEDLQAQLARLVGRRFIAETAWEPLGHLPRYLKGVQLRLDKLRAEPARDAARLAELRPLEQRWLRAVADRKGAPDARLDEFRWLIEELRIGLFAQELRTPQPVSVKRLEKLWSQLDRRAA